MAVSKRLGPDAGDAGWDRNTVQTVAVLERFVADVGDTVANHEVGYFAAVRERLVPDARHAVGNRHAGHGAIKEGAAPDARDVGADCEVGETVAQEECPGPNISNAVGDYDTGQQAALLERIGFNAGDAVGDRDIGQTAKLERPTPDARNEQAVDVGRNDHIPATAVIIGDGDGVRIVAIYAVLETIT